MPLGSVGIGNRQPQVISIKREEKLATEPKIKATPANKPQGVNTNPISPFNPKDIKTFVDDKVKSVQNKILPDAYKKLTWAEKIYYKSHPLQAFKMNQIKKNVEYETAKGVLADTSLPNRRDKRKALNDGKWDAFRHALIGIKTTRALGADSAISILTNHELLGQNKKSRAKMDMHNNVVGIQAALNPVYDKYSDQYLAKKLLGSNLLVTSLDRQVTGNLSMPQQTGIFNQLDDWGAISKNVLEWFN